MGRTFIIKGKYSFDYSERADLANQLAHCQINRGIVEDERKSVMATYKDRLDRLTWESGRLSRCVADGFEMRDFECSVTFDSTNRIKMFTDIRTGKHIDTKPMEPSDYQIEMQELEDKQREEEEAREKEDALRREEEERKAEEKPIKKTKKKS